MKFMGQKHIAFAVWKNNNILGSIFKISESDICELLQSDNTPTELLSHDAGASPILGTWQPL
jgi:hypothetical protein